MLDIEEIYDTKVKRVKETIAAEELLEELQKVEEEKRKLIEEFAAKMEELELRRVTIIKKLKISKSDVLLDDIKIQAKPVEIDVEGKEVRIEPSPKGLALVEGGVKAEGDVEFEYENRTLIALNSGKPIKFLPSQVKDKVRGELKEIKIVDEEIPKYIAKGEEEGKLLWIIPVKVKMDYEINAETGKVITVKKPWWVSLLGVEIEPVIIEPIELLPDLVVTEIVQGYDERVNDLYYNVTIKNIGTASAGGPSPSEIVTAVYIEEERIGWIHLYKSLSPGESYTHTLDRKGMKLVEILQNKNWLEQRPGERPVIKALVDFENNIAEKDEDNQEREGPIPVAFVSGIVFDADGCRIEGAGVLFRGDWAGLIRSGSDGSYSGLLLYKPTYVISSEEYPDGTPLLSSTQYVTLKYFSETPWLDPYNAYPSIRLDDSDFGWMQVNIAPPPIINKIDIEAVYRSPEAGGVDGVHIELAKHLAEVHNPIWKFDSGELFYPADVEQYITRARLWFNNGRSPGDHYLLINDSLRVGEISDYVVRYNPYSGEIREVFTIEEEEYEPPSPSPSEGELVSAIYKVKSWEDRPFFLSLFYPKREIDTDFFQTAPHGSFGGWPDEVPVYVQVISERQFLPDISSPNDQSYGIRYSLFFEYNLHPDFPDHEGDWATVDVFVRRGEIESAHFHKHGFRPDGTIEIAGYTFTLTDPNFKISVPGREIEKANRTHPVIYIASGSHATYHFPGETHFIYDVKEEGTSASYAEAAANYGERMSMWREHPDLYGGTDERDDMRGTDSHYGDASGYHRDWGIMYDQHSELYGVMYKIHLVTIRDISGLNDDLVNFRGHWGRDWLRYDYDIPWWPDDLYEFGSKGYHWLSPTSPFPWHGE